MRQNENPFYQIPQPQINGVAERGLVGEIFVFFVPLCEDISHATAEGTAERLTSFLFQAITRPIVSLLISAGWLTRHGAGR